MDIHGIGNAMKANISMYRQSSRRTGRTVAMVEALKDGDRVLFTNKHEADRVKRMCNERGFDIRTKVVESRKLSSVLTMGTSQGRTVMDHTLVEELYQIAVDRCAQEIDQIHEMLSGFGEPHLQTKRASIEAQKFGKW